MRVRGDEETRNEEIQGDCQRCDAAVKKQEKELCEFFAGLASSAVNQH